MDEELVKRNTDCVYFLASPFTCKKGAECEYRHSEMARLNPRDCWYWLSGNCLNPTCAFRHPPMDVPAEKSAQVQDEPVPNSSSLATTKSNVPCYFYFNGYCTKGDTCSFLHSSEDASAVKPKIDSASTAAPPLDTKIPSKASVPKVSAEPLDAKIPSVKLDTKIRSRDNKVSIITEPVADPPENGTGLLEVALEADNKVPLRAKKQIQTSDTYNIIERKNSRHSIASEFEETNVSKSPSLKASEIIVKSDPSIYSDQSSEDQVDKDVVRDEWWESSPGFDVLVEGKSEGMTYEDEDEYMHGYNDGYDGNDEDHGNPFLKHRYEDRNESSDRFLLENRIHEPAYYSDDDERHNLNGFSHGDRRTNHSMPQKRKFLAIGLPVRGHYSGDLREHLSKRRFHAEEDIFRHCNFPLHTEERRGEPQPSSIQRLHGRLASKLERNGVSLTAERSAFVTPNQRGRPRNSQLTTKHHQHERKRLQFSSRIQRRPFSRQKRDSNNDISFSGPRQKRDYNNDISFSGPKSLAQIKEGKDRTREDATSSREARDSGQYSSVNFDGPKPFTEILKEKKRGSSGQDEDINISS